MKRQSFIKGTIILMISALVTKIIGAFFKIPLANMLGGTGMGYFSGAYGIFLPVYAVFVTGLSAAAAKLTAENYVLYGNDGVKKIKKYSIIGFSVTGITGSIFLFLAAGIFSDKIAGDRNIYPSVIVTVPAIFFSCVTAAYRGVAEGQRNMYPTGISQLTEAVVKLTAGLWLCRMILKSPEYFSQLTAEKYSDKYALSAAGAALGVTLSSFAGMLWMIGDDIFSKKEESAGVSEEKCRTEGKDILISLFRFAAPAAVSALLSNLASVVDLTTIVRYLKESVAENPHYYSEKYSFFNDIGADKFPAFVYGSFSGIAVTVFNLVPAVTNMIGKSILPSATEAWVRKENAKLCERTISVLKLTAIISVPAAIGLFVLSGEILSFLFPSSVNEVVVSVRSLKILCPAVIFVSLSFPVFSILQAIGSERTPAKIMLSGLLLKFAGNVILVKIPALSIDGAAISTLVCYIFIFILSIYKFYEKSGIKISVSTFLIKPLFSGISCGFAALLCKNMLISESNIVTILFSVISGGTAYIICLWLSGELKWLLSLK